MDSARLTYLFHRYVDGKCTDAEKNEFLDAVSEPRHESHLKHLMDGLWYESSGKDLTTDRSISIIENIVKSDRDVVPIRRESFYLPLGKIAACLVLIIIGSAAALHYIDRERSADASHAEASLDSSQPGFIKLPDGSTVILKKGSKLEFPQSFTANLREVTLTGEGYFDIMHDATRAFIVHTGKVKTTVLGTAFNIKAYPDQSDITVTVTRGKVKVSDDNQVFAIVNPDQQITFNKKRELIEQKVVDSHQVIAWMEKDIYFDDITVGEAIEQLEKRFGITISLGDTNVGNCKFTATFVKGEDIEQILRIICDFNNATLVLDGSNSFEIQGGACSL